MARKRNGFVFFRADPAGRERLGGVVIDLRPLVFGEDDRPCTLSEISKDDGLWLERW
ncbi:MAG: hypothetical protein HPY45_06540 [Anaerolineae bacterium]|nr:hypothetical protein [Anaerolineae bacterium]